MEQLFESGPRLNRGRDKAIETITGNLIMCGLLKLNKAGKFMMDITRCNDSELAKILLTSKQLYERYLQTHWNMN